MPDNYYGQKSARVFFAFDLSKTVREALKKCYDRTLDVSWVRPENLHITMNFLGELDQQNIEQICAAAESVCAVLPPARVEIIRAAPERTMIWAHIKPNRTLSELHARLDAEMGQLLSNYQSRHRFRPHVCLARSRRILTDSHFPPKDFSGLDFEATHLVLYQSTLSAGGSVYTSLDAFPLSGEEEEKKS